MAVIHNLIPHFIHDRFEAGQFSGRFQAVTMFMDVSGSTSFTQAMLVHGKRGAEILSRSFNQLFEPVIQAVYTHGGFITGFAGDAFSAVFLWDKDDAPMRACKAAQTIRVAINARSEHATPFGEYLLEGRLGLSVGEVEWGIVGPGGHRAFFFRGPAIEGAGQAERRARGGEVVVDKRLTEVLVPLGLELLPIGDGFSLLEADRGIVKADALARLGKTIRRLPAQKEQVAAYFFLYQYQHLLKSSIPGEFRNAAIVFINFEASLDFTVLDAFVTCAIETADWLYGHFSEIDFGDKGAVLLFYFGAPEGHEDDIKRALNFVLDFRERLEEQGLSHLKWRAGITYGPVYSGLTGTPYRGKYSLLGLMVNFAALLMDKTEWGRIAVSEVVSQEPDFEFKRAGEFAYKGFNNLVPTYWLFGKRIGKDRVFDLAMTGRLAELEQLLQAVTPIFSERFAGVAVIYGDPGMGKSRLAHELRQRLAGRVTWFTAQNDHVLRQPFGPFVSWLKRFFNQLSDVSHTRNLENFEQRLYELISDLKGSSHSGTTTFNALVTTLQQKKSFLGGLLGLRWTGSLYETIDVQGRFHNTLLAIKSLLLAESRLCPVIFEIEDGQRLDHASQELLRFLTYHVDSYPFFILLTSRYGDDGSPLPFRFAPDTPVTNIHLQNLSRASISMLAKSILEDPVDDELLEVILEKSQGNPFFAQQFLYYFQNRGLLRRNSTPQYTTWGIRPVPEYELPASIQPILTAQIDRLSPPEREVVMVAAVLGLEFDVRLLAHILEKDVYTIVKQVEQAKIWETQDGLTYTFRHELLRDAARSMQMESRIQYLHFRAARAYEVLYSEQLAKNALQIAYHYRQAEDMENERKYIRLAGEQAAARFANAEAITCFSRALDLTPAGDVDTRFGILLAREKVYDLQGVRERQAEDLAALISLAEISGDMQKIARAHLRQANYLEKISDYQGAINAVQPVIQLAQITSPDDHPIANLIAQAYLAWGSALYLLSDYPSAQEKLEYSLASFRALNDMASVANNLHVLGHVFTNQGKLAQAHYCYTQVLALHKETGNRRDQARAINSLGALAAERGNFSEQQDYFEQSLQINREIGNRPGEADTLNNLGTLFAYVGEYTRARDRYMEALEIYLEVRDRFGEELTLHNLGEVFIYMGLHTEAMASYRQSVYISREIGDKDGEARSLRHIGLIQLDLGQLDEGLLAIQQALALREEMEQDKFLMDDLSALANSYVARGEQDRAMAYVDEILENITRNPTLESVEDPFRVYLTCYQILQAARDARAPIILTNARRLLLDRAESIQEKETRQKFLQNVPWHKEILERWEQQD